MDWSSTPTVIVAIIAVGIGYAQWQTAHQKVMLDLFDRRLGLFYAVIEAIDPIMAHGSVRTPDGHRMRSFTLAARDARFLFGDDVYDYLESLRRTLHAKHHCEDMMQIEGKEYENWVTRNAAAMREVFGFYEKFPTLCEPYLRMDQKRVRSPVRWLLEMLGFSRARALANPSVEKLPLGGTLE